MLEKIQYKKGRRNSMTTENFISTILNHKTGFVISTGDANGECHSSYEMDTVFFDGATLIESAYDSKWLDFSNEKSKGLGTAYICLGDVKKVIEHSGDYLTDCFQLSTLRVFEVEMMDKQNTKTVCIIGLM